MDWQQEKLTVDVFLGVISDIRKGEKIPAIKKIRAYFAGGGVNIGLREAKYIADAVQAEMGLSPDDKVIAHHYLPSIEWERKAIRDGGVVSIALADSGETEYCIKHINSIYADYGIGFDVNSARYSAWYGYMIAQLMAGGLTYDAAGRMLDTMSWAK